MDEHDSKNDRVRTPQAEPSSGGHGGERKERRERKSLKENIYRHAGAVIILIFAAALVLLVSRIDLFSRMQASQPLLPNRSVLPGDEEKIYESLHGGDVPAVTVYPDLSEETVMSLLKTAEMPASFCWYYRSTLYSTRRSRTRTGILKFEQENRRVELYAPDGTLEKTVTENDGKVSVRTVDGSADFSSGAVSMFAEAGVPEVASFLENAGDDWTFSLVESDYGTLLYAEFLHEKGAYRQLEQYYISLDYAIVVRADCYENDVLVYSLNTTALYEL